jgi:hypothetical protein
MAQRRGATEDCRDFFAGPGKMRLMSTRFAISVRLASLLALTFALPAAASAGAINKWVGADGVTHYSDEAPGADATDVTSVEVAVSHAQRVNVEDDYYSVANQWKRMQAERLAMAKIKLEKARLEAQSKPDVVYYVNYYERRVIGSPVLWFPRHRMRYRRYHRSPGQPIAVPHRGGRRMSGGGSPRAPVPGFH